MSVPPAHAPVFRDAPVCMLSPPSPVLQPFVSDLCVSPVDPSSLELPSPIRDAEFIPHSIISTSIIPSISPPIILLSPTSNKSISKPIIRRSRSCSPDRSRIIDDDDYDDNCEEIDILYPVSSPVRVSYNKIPVPSPKPMIADVVQGQVLPFPAVPPYAPIHLNTLSLHIAPSIIPRANYGVFANRLIKGPKHSKLSPKRASVIISYESRIAYSTRIDPFPEDDTFKVRDGNYWFSPSPQHHNIAMYINTITPAQQKQHHLSINCYLRAIYRKKGEVPELRVYASRTILPGEELFLSYGSSYYIHVLPQRRHSDADIVYNPISSYRTFNRPLPQPPPHIPKEKVKLKSRIYKPPKRIPPEIFRGAHTKTIQPTVTITTPTQPTTTVILPPPPVLPKTTIKTTIPNPMDISPEHKYYDDTMTSHDLLPTNTLEEGEISSTLTRKRKLNPPLRPPPIVRNLVAQLRQALDPNISPHTAPSPSTGTFVVSTLIDSSVPVEAVLDTAADVNLLDINIFYQLSLETRLNLQPVKHKDLPTSITGDALTIHGKIIISIQFNTHIYSVCVYVTNSPGRTGLLLGNGFLRKHCRSLDFQHNILYLHHEFIFTRAACDCPPEILGMLTSEVMLPPRSETCICVSIYKRTPKDIGLYVTSPTPFPIVKDVFVQRSLVELKEPMTQELVVILCNTSLTPVLLAPMSPLISLSPVLHVHNVTLPKNNTQTAHIPHSIPIPSSIETELNSINLSHLTTSQQIELRKILIQHKTLFDGNISIPANLPPHEIKIDSKHDRPVFSAPYRHSIPDQIVIDRAVNDMIQKGVVVPAISPWASPVVLVSKPDGSLRFCVDYRKLNMITERDSHPLPHINDTLLNLSDAKWFTSIDLQSGFWQIPVHNDDIPKTAFVTRTGLYVFLRMPFGLRNAPATFQRALNILLSGLNYKNCLVYIDDILIYSKDFDQHLIDLHEIFSRLESVNLKARLEKCSFAQSTIKFLGHTISSTGIKPNPDKIAAIRDFPTPHDVRSVRSFVQTASYYRRFIRNFASIVSPLHKLTKKNQEFVWSDECEKSFSTIKTLMCSSPILRNPDWTRDFLVHVDASYTGLGAILGQTDFEDREYVIAYASRSLRPPEINYTVTELECSAIVFAIKQFKVYLHGHHFTIVTDHWSLQWLASMKEKNAKLTRWSLMLQDFDYNVKYRPGSIHIPDSLSRHPVDIVPSSFPDGNVVHFITRSKRKLLPDSDSIVSSKRVKIRRNVPPVLPSIPDITTSSSPESKQKVDDSDKQHEIDKIIAEDLDPNTNEPLYKIRWKGYSSKYDEWIYAHDINAPDILHDWFHSKERADLLGYEYTLEVEQKKIDPDYLPTLLHKQAHQADTIPIGPHVPLDPHFVSPPESYNQELILDIKNKQQSDPFIRSMTNFLVYDILPDNKEQQYMVLKTSHLYSHIDGFLYRLHDKTPIISNALVVPMAYQNSLITIYHDDPLSGHQSAERTYDRIRQYYYFPKMYHMIYNYCLSCHICNTHKVSHLDIVILY